VWLKEGDGRFTINQREIYEYFPRAAYREKLVEPFVVTDKAGAFDVWCTVKGGGTTGREVISARSRGGGSLAKRGDTTVYSPALSYKVC
jgi:ribosomal protein S9